VIWRPFCALLKPTAEAIACGEDIGFDPDLVEIGIGSKGGVTTPKAPRIAD
jgi:hypothetical protein